MMMSLFFLAVAADCIAHAAKRVAHMITMVLRPSSLLIASTVLLGVLGYWLFRSTEADLERADRDPTPELEIAPATDE